MAQHASEWIELVASDGSRISAYHVVPGTPPRGGLVVVQEIFGVNEHIRRVCEGFAAHGYEVVAPAFFDRVEPRFEVGYDAASVQRARALKALVSWDDALLDVAAARAQLAHAGKVGIVGYCWGGSIAYLSAVRVDGLSVAVGYYGGEVAKHAGEPPRVPTLLHFGEHDKGIPLTDVQRVREQRPDVEVYTYPADHGFNCEMRGAYHAPSAELALERTLAAFARNIG